jgi:2-hydroxyacyl-CoA lyase 1
MAFSSPTGAQLIARTLRDLGVTVIFGLVGVPVSEIAEEALNIGIKFIGFRNEQAASYAATGFGYLTGKPGVLLLVGGPGVLHGMAGVRYLLVIKAIGRMEVRSRLLIFCNRSGTRLQTHFLCLS